MVEGGREGIDSSLVKNSHAPQPGTEADVRYERLVEENSRRWWRRWKGEGEEKKIDKATLFLPHIHLPPIPLPLTSPTTTLSSLPLFLSVTASLLYAPPLPSPPPLLTPPPSTSALPSASILAKLAQAGYHSILQQLGE